MTKRILLDIDSKPSTYTFIGLSTSLKDYRLTFLLNKIPGLQFTRISDLTIQHQGSEEPSVFSLYSSDNEEALNTCYLISNRSDSNVLVPLLKQVDYILIFDGPIKKRDKTELIATFRTIPNLQLAIEVKPESVRQFESLISDLELHLMNETKYKPEITTI